MERPRYFTAPANIIEENPNNFYHITDEMVENRCASIKEFGLLNKLKVTDHPTEPEKLLLYGGATNFRGGKMAGLTEFEVEYKHFTSHAEMKRFLRVENDQRIKNMHDRAMEIYEDKQDWSLGQGARSDLKGQTPTDTRKRLVKKYDFSGPTIDQILTILEEWPSMFDLIDRKILTIGGAHNCITFLKKKGMAKLTDEQMMEQIIEAASSVVPGIKEKFQIHNDKIRPDSRDEHASLECAFKYASTQVGTVLQNLEAKEKGAMSNKKNGTVIAPSAKQGTPSPESHSLPPSAKDEPVSTGNAENNYKTSDKGNTGRQNTNAPIATPGSPNIIESPHAVNGSVDVPEIEIQETDTIPGNVIPEQSTPKDEVAQNTPRILYVKDANGNFVEYTCEHAGCPFRNCKI